MTQTYLQQLSRGVVESLLLYLISELPTHGYRIAKELEKRSHGYLKFNGSTIYCALRRLEEKGLVLSSWQQVTQGQRRRYYELTKMGRQILAGKLGEWQTFCSAISKVISS